MSNNMQAGKPHICPVCRTPNSLADNDRTWKCQAHVGNQVCGHEIPKVYIPNTLDASATLYSQRQSNRNATQDAQFSRQASVQKEDPLIQIRQPNQRSRPRLALIIICVVIIIVILALVFIFRRPWFEFSIA